MILVREAESPGHAAAVASLIEAEFGFVVNICHAAGYNTWFVFFRMSSLWGDPKTDAIQKLDEALAKVPRR